MLQPLKGRVITGFLQFVTQWYYRAGLKPADDNVNSRKQQKRRTTLEAYHNS